MIIITAACPKIPKPLVVKLAKSGTDSNGNERRIIIIPIDRLKDVTKYNGKQVKVTIDEI